MSGEVDPLSILKELLPNPDESYYIGLCILCIIVPMVVSVFYAISDVYRIVKDNPSYDVGNFRYFVRNAYYLIVATMVVTVVNMLYALRKRPEKADAKNIGFWYTLSTFLLFFLLGARLSLLISMISVTNSDNIINLNPSEVVYIRTKLSYLTIVILVSFMLSIIGFVLINGSQIIDLIVAFKAAAAAMKEDMS